MADSRLQVIVDLKDRASAQVQKIQNSVSGLSGSMEKATTSNTFAKGLGAVGAALGTAGFFGLKFEAEMETARIGLETLLGSAEQADSTLVRIKEEAKRTPFEILGLTQAVQLLSSVTKDGDKSIDVILDVGEGLAAMGKGQAELDRIIVNLQQIAALGSASSIDIKQFAFAGIPIFEMLQEQTGLSGEALDDFITSGGVTFDLLTDMFDKANDEGGRFFEAYINQTGSLTQLWSNFKDELNTSVGAFVKQIGLFDAAKVAIAFLTDNISVFFEKVSETITFLQENQWVIYVLAGAIIGALVPSIYAAATAFAALAISLAPFLIGGALIGGIVAGIVWIVKNWDMIKERATAIWNAILQTVLSVVTAIGAFIFDKFKQVSDFISSIYTGIKEAIEAVLNGIFAVHRYVVGLIVGLVLSYFESMGIDLIAIFEQMQIFIETIWNTISEFFVTKVERFKELFAGGMDYIKSVWVAGWNTVKSFFVDNWNTLSQLASDGLDRIKGRILEATKPVTDAFSSVWESVKNVTKIAFDGINNMVKGLVNSIFEKINKLIRAANSVAQKGADAVGIKVPNIPEIPLLAEGGIVTKPTLAGIGEAGPEAVIPLNKSKLAGLGLGTTINVTVEGDVTGEDLIDRVGKELVKVIQLSTAVS